MNQDNQRLQSIQRFKTIIEKKLVIKQQLEDAESISECMALQDRYDDLEKEEKKILQRCDVII